MTTSTLTRAQSAEPHRVLARLLITNAHGFMEAARGLWGLHLRGSTFEHPFVFCVNLGFAYEHSLKAFLAHRRWPEDRLRKEIGHNLDAALREARAVGYAPAQEVENLIHILSPLHDAPYELRYLKDKSLNLPRPLSEALKITQRHFWEMGHQIPIADLGDWD